MLLDAQRMDTWPSPFVVPYAVPVLNNRSQENRRSAFPISMHTHINTWACIFCLLLHKAFAHPTLSSLLNVEVFSILQGKSQTVPSRQTQQLWEARSHHYRCHTVSNTFFSAIQLLLLVFFSLLLARNFFPGKSLSHGNYQMRIHWSSYHSTACSPLPFLLPILTLCFSC